MAGNTEVSESIDNMDVEEGICQDDVEMAFSGINMLLNNGLDEARALFEKYKEDSALMDSGYNFVFFMQALMSFEEEKLAEAQKILQDTQKKCESGKKIFRSVRRKFSKRKQSEMVVNLESRIQREVIVADSLLYQSVLIFTNQDLTSYVKGGWYLRKAWKHYERIHKEVTMLRLKVKKSDSETSSLSDGKNENVSKDGAMDGNFNEIPDDVLERLLGAVSFGFGSFQLGISMVPPKILKIIEFLGFEGDREGGLESLVFTSHSKDMKAPLATLALLWYHTVLRPFFALDGANNISAGIKEAEAIINEKEGEFSNSSLFLFFKGRIHRLRTENEEALCLYQKALEAAAGQRELELMCVYEISWCNLLKLRWNESLAGFSRLREESKWSKCYYAYLVAVSLGSLGDVKGSHDVFKEVPGLMKRKNNQIEAFVSRRAEKMKRQPPTQEYCKLLTLELAFLWHAIPTCTDEELRAMLEVCDLQTNKNVFHLKALIEGSIYKELKEEEMSIQILEEALARHQGMKEDYHVTAFALFELSTIYMKNVQTHGKAKKLLLQIKDYSKEYDFENRLSVRVSNALKRLKQHEQSG